LGKKESTMNIALPILLLVFGSLSFWVLSESSLKWYLKSACISVFCVFTVIFWLCIHSFLGWPANESDMPEKMLIHWVIIKEPSKLTSFEGGIYILSESADEVKASEILRFFGYKNKHREPRLYSVKYSRDLHEQLEKGVKSKLKNGQPVLGKLSKIKGLKRKGEGESKKGQGDESQKQEWQFHELLPSEIQPKPQD